MADGVCKHAAVHTCRQRCGPEISSAVRDCVRCAATRGWAVLKHQPALEPTIKELTAEEEGQYKRWHACEKERGHAHYATSFDALHLHACRILSSG